MKTTTLILALMCIICLIIAPICITWYAMSLDYRIKHIVYLCLCTSSFSCVSTYMLVKVIKDILD